MPRHLKSAKFYDSLSSISNTTPKKSLKILKHSTVKGETLPNLIELVFLSLKAINVKTNH